VKLAATGATTPIARASIQISPRASPSSTAIAA